MRQEPGDINSLTQASYYIERLMRSKKPEEKTAELFMAGDFEASYEVPLGGSSRK